MNNDLIENHLKNLEKLEKLKLKKTSTEDSTNIKFKELKKINLKSEDIMTINKVIYYLKNSYKLVYLPIKITYLFILSLVIFYIINEKKIEFKQVYIKLEKQNLL